MGFRRNTLWMRLFAGAMALVPMGLLAASGEGALPKLDYTRFVLPNGLTVVVHEDHKAPVVAVGIWYHIGSADEPAGKTGFAHLFEHLMFSGSEHHPGTYFQPFEQVGATNMNGTTWFDRTNYFETVPTTALDMALWMESDRMGHLLGAIGQKELDTQRGVVQNEKRQGENRPYGRVDQNILSNTLPANHPYAHDTIGSMKDLNAASLADVKGWFHANYGAANTTLVLSGDITPAQARSEAERYFGDIPAGPPVARQQPWITPLAGDRHGIQHDHVAQPRIIRTWVVPQLGTRPAIDLDLATTILGGGRTSRLYQRLVYQDHLVDDVSASISPFALASQVQIQADVKKGVDPARVEAVIEEVIKAFLREGPTADELARAKIQMRANTIRQLDDVTQQGFFLAEGQVYRHDPEAFRKDLQQAMATTPADLKQAAADWLGKGSYTLQVLPATATQNLAAEDAAVRPLPAAAGRPAAIQPAKAAYRTTASTVDRSKGVPVVSQFPGLHFPKVERARLSNGIQVILAARHAIPVTDVQLLFNAGYAADHGGRLGTAAFTSRMMSESTQKRDSVAVIEAEQRLGAQINFGVGLDMSNASLSALNDQLQASLDLLSEMVLQPAFKAGDMQRVRGQWLANIAQQKTEPMSMALRTLPPLLYGTDHAYGVPFTGSGTEASIQSLQPADLVAFQQHWLRPDNVTILVSGDTSLAKIVPALDKAFGHWQAPAGPVPVKSLSTVAAQPVPRVFLIDRPDAPQSVVMAGLLAPSTLAPNNLALKVANDAFGGTFTSRINMNLRENKRWAYGAFSILINAIGQRPLLFYAPVQSDKTAPSITEVLHEAQGVIGAHPLTEAEVEKIKDNDIRSLPGAYQTADAVLDALSGNVMYHRPDDYVTTLAQHLQAVHQPQAQAAIEEMVHPQALTWVIVGDLKQIEAPVRALNLGKVEVLDADGKPVQTSKP
ncbi:M16 family metallopeptidase [Frateuria aurantia]|uniref:Putative Zn-dependent peptidase n=1 Tax=Frateuria aurantia (strain ATCC 33424 / DSM 6220 / KCTC 2777 / LMG 1558 / NBRC 3245 / NCIMB 13370) TaxID=767434 RepID=H8L0E0_FRAAD|nr:putative Zn-dependent peptidase [Frateuria aurantia DSM 6220]